MPNDCPKCSECLAQDLLELLKFSTSFVETQSKVTEVLAFVKSISQGPIRLREPEPKSQTHLWAAGQLQALLLIMEKVRHGFDCAHIISAKLMIQDEKKKNEAPVITMTNASLPSGGFARMLHAKEERSS